VRNALRIRDFRLLFAGQAVSAVGDQVFPVAVSVLVLDTGGGAADLGIVLAARFAALVLFALLGGVWADRLPRVRVLVSADLLRLAAVLGLLVATSVSTVPLPVLAGLVFLVGAGEAFFRPAYGALLPSVLPPPSLAAGNALSASSAQLAQVVGPGLGGLLMAAAGARAGFVLDATTFAISLVTLLRVREPEHLPAPRTRVVAEMAEGIRAVRERPWIAWLLGVFALNLMLVYAPVVILLPLMVREQTGETASYGYVLAAGAFGGLIGALVAGRWKGPARGRWATLGLALLVAQPVALLLGAGLPVLCVAWAIAGLGLGPFIVQWETALQADVPRHLLARVISLDWMATFGLFPLGLALTGPAVAAFGRSGVLALGVVIAVVLPLLVLRVPGVREFRTPVTGPGSASG
jgi:MFS family permease